MRYSEPIHQVCMSRSIKTCLFLPNLAYSKLVNLLAIYFKYLTHLMLIQYSSTSSLSASVHVDHKTSLATAGPRRVNHSTVSSTFLYGLAKLMIFSLLADHFLE